MTNNQAITVVLAFDDKYVAHGATTIVSALENKKASDQLLFIVLDTGLSNESRQKIRGLVDERAGLDFVTVSAELIGHLPNQSHAVSTYARIFLPMLRPTLHKAIYIDSDVVVLSSLSELWSLDLEDKICGVVQDAMCQLSPEDNDSKRFPSIPHMGYFNAGVLLIDMEKWKERLISEETLKVIENMGSRLLHSDQDALNLSLSGNVKYLHPRWNFQTPLARPIWNGFQYAPDWHEAYKSPSIIHYTTNQKPWIFGSFPAFKSWYWVYRNKTGIAKGTNEVFKLGHMPAYFRAVGIIVRNRISSYCRKVAAIFK